MNQRIVYLNNQHCYISASKGRDKEGKPELHIIISFNKPDDALEIYMERWQIETVFRALKTSGFNIETTCLTEIESYLHWSLSLLLGHIRLVIICTIHQTNSNKKVWKQS